MRTGLLTACIGAVCVALFFSGCKHRPTAAETKRATVAGTVTLDGRPLPCGGITFVSKTDPKYQATAMIRPDGGFSIDDAPIGTVGVSVTTESFVGDSSYVAIPTKYADTKTSGLSAEVRADETKPLSFELKSNQNH